MPTLTVSANTNFSATVLSGIDIIDFTGAFTATFAASQFDNVQILNAVLIDGSAGVNQIIINGGAVNVLSWTFANWTDGQDTITFNGTAAADVYLGTGHDDIFNNSGGDDFVSAGNGNDIITGGDGGDELHGGAGNDRFIFSALDLDAGETIFGDADIDTLQLNQAAAAYLFSTNATTLTGMELIEFNSTNAVTGEFTGGQMVQFTGVTGGAGADTLRVLGAADLSALAFTNWSANDSVRLLGTAAGETMTGTSQDDFFNGGAGNDILNGGDGDDTFNYTAAADVAGAGEQINGGNGLGDRIELVNTGIILLNTAAVSGVETLDFVSGSSTATLTGAQIGSIAGRIRNVDGSAGSDALAVTGTSVNLGSVAFTNWSATDTITINGELAAINSLVGTDFVDTINGGGLGDFFNEDFAGADILNGGDGADSFTYNLATSIEAGEQINGSGDFDSIIASTFSVSVVFDFSGAIITGVERLVFENSGDSIVTLLGSQVGSGLINEFRFNSGTGANSVNILGAADLSTLAITGVFSLADSITITDDAGDDVIIGSSVRDIIIDSAGDDVLSGGGGDDRFVINSAFAQLNGVIDGGAGLGDTLVQNTGIGGNFYTAASLLNVERLEFGANGGSGNFADVHFGLAAGRINLVTGSALADRFDITGAAIDLSGVTFNSWTNGVDSILQGTSGADVITGSSQNDFIFIGSGDAADGGLGNDEINISGALAGGTEVEGGGGTGDRIIARGLTDLTGILITGIELLQLRANAGFLDANVTVAGTQIGAGAITNIIGSADSDTLNINGALVDLSAVTFANWTNGADTININGTSGSDIFHGSSQNDIMRGGLGNDQYFVDNIGDVTDDVTGGGGTDFVFSTVSFTAAQGIERLILQGAGNINATGCAAQNDILLGNSGANILDGLTGADVMRGGLGNDQYFVDNALDTTDEVNGGGGTDFVFSTVSFSAAAGIERLILTGTANINATGRAAQNDILLGNNGNNTLDGLSGADVMRGGLGNDTYFVDNALDTTDEVNGGGGTDFVFSTVSFSAAAGIERLILTGTANINATGRAAQNDIIFGNSGINTLSGLTGNDVLIGGLGSDTLTGGAGLDTFRFDAALGATNMDTVTDFIAADDVMQLENAIFTLLGVTGTLAANLFRDLALGAQDADDVIIYNRATGALFYDSNGITAGGQTQFADLTNGLIITNSDFVVI